MSLNVRGLHNSIKRKCLYKLLRWQHTDICMIQESHSTDALAPLWEAEWGGKMFFSHGKSNARGTCILISNRFGGKIVNDYSDSNGRYVILEVEIEDKCFLFVNVYAPNSDEPAFFTRLIAKIESFECEHIVWGGRF